MGKVSGQTDRTGYVSGRGGIFRLQGRSGSVALPRAKLVLAMEVMGLAARRPARTTGVVRSRADDIIGESRASQAMSAGVILVVNRMRCDGKRRG